MENHAPDGIDVRILALLAENARISFAELGRRVGLSRVSVSGRVAALERQGVILGYRAVIAPAADRIRFTLDLETAPEAYDAVAARLAAEPAVVTLWKTTGECRLHAVAEAAGSEEMKLLVRRLYRDAEGIRRLSCRTVLEVVRERA